MIQQTTKQINLHHTQTQVHTHKEVVLTRKIHTQTRIFTYSVHTFYFIF